MESLEHLMIRKIIEKGITPYSLMQNTGLSYIQYVNALKKPHFKLSFDKFKKLLNFYCYVQKFLSDKKDKKDKKHG